MKSPSPSLDPPAALPNLRHLALCCRVAGEGSVSAAARALHLTQPAVTQALQSVERELGGPLFRREAGVLVLTTEGSLACARLERALELLRRALAETRECRLQTSSTAR